MSEKDIKTQQEQEVGDITGLINPFPGLRPFGVEESHLFFGREGQSDEVLTKLSDNRFVAILGSSGSGKSSFMYCGLIPSLNGGFMTDAGSNWKVVVARPGGGPIDNLAESILMRDKTYASLTEEDQVIKKTIIGTVLRSSSLGLVEVIRQLKGDKNQNVLIVIDQFEELFRFRKMESATSDQDESTAFVNLLLEAIHQFDEPIYVTITMRSDFIGECAKFPDLTQMINDSHYLIPQMTRDQKRMAIEGPVAVGGGKISPRLSQQLLNDVGDNPDQLPILQHALMRTWSFWTENRKPDEPIDLRHYNAIGTLKEALSQHANEAYDNLSKREKEICEVMFKALTERGSENQGIRRPTKLGTIASIAGVSEDEVIRVVDKFREPGRSLLMPPHGVRLESDTVIDISHESLMRIWDRLKRWLDEESRAAEMYMKLAEAAERYQEGRASLWKMPDLQLAINWKEENNPTIVWGQRYNPAFERSMVFLETSIRAWETEQRNKELLQKRKVKFFRITAIVLGGAAL
ncbi:MAG: High-affnity carbon uptake protein Hat/HatR, partial [Cyclobacteriaceae bacterium]